MPTLFKRHTLLLPFTLLLSLQACSSLEESNPDRTATEQLLISTAAERAASKLDLKIPAGSKVFVDSSNFEGTDSKYALSAIRSRLLSRGVQLTNEQSKADVIVEPRAGALSTDRKNFVVGIPEFEVPLPLASSSISIPEIAFYGKAGQVGVASLAAVSYDSKTGRYIDAESPQFGYAHNDEITLLVLFSWMRNDTIPEDQEED